MMVKKTPHFLFLILTPIVFFIACTSNNAPEKPTKLAQKIAPNIIIIYADDLGYGDVGAYGATELKTPNMDKLANGGIKFTNGYASSATCSPSRYALLTGTYPWRNKRAKILSGTAPLLIDTAQMTLPKLLKTQRLSYWNCWEMASRVG